MDDDFSNNGAKIPCQIPLHHHHQFYISRNCKIHSSILNPKNHNNNSSSCTFSYYPPPIPPQTLEPLASSSIPPNNNNPNQTSDDADTLMVHEEIEDLELDENEEPIFVLTDEWREFFAKSEAKRRQAKKQAKKGKK